MNNISFPRKSPRFAPKDQRFSRHVGRCHYGGFVVHTEPRLPSGSAPCVGHRLGAFDFADYRKGKEQSVR